jgi:hypothetical protein
MSVRACEVDARAYISVMSGAQLFMKEDLKITDTQIEILAGIISIYSLFGSLVAGMTSDWLGRRYTMVLAAAIFFTGALIMGLALNYAFLMAGHFVAGIGVGYALMIVPVYTAEVAPTSSRGFLTTFPEVFNNFGILLDYVSNFAFARLPVHQSWRAMFLAGAVPPVFLGFAVLAMPESPRWLVMRGRIEDMRHVLRRTSDSHEEAEERLLGIKRVVGIPTDATDAGDVVAIVRANEAARGQGVWKEMLINPTTRASLCSACSWPASAHVHPTGHGRRLCRDVQPTGVPGCRHQVQNQLARGVHGGGRVQDLLHTHHDAPPRPHRAEAAAARQRRQGWTSSSSCSPRLCSCWTVGRSRRRRR